MKTLVIIPCYNEEENLSRVVERLHAAAPDVDYLIVNDCSTDGSAALCRARGYNYISLPVNLGIGGGVQSGYLYAREHGYDVTVQMDGDGQHNPLFLADVVRPVAEGRLDMCIGSACNKELTAYFADHYAQDYPEPEAIITAVLNGYRVGEAPVVMEERMGGKSSISPFKSVYYMVKVSIALVVFRITSGRRKEGRA